MDSKATEIRPTDGAELAAKTNKLLIGIGNVESFDRSSKSSTYTSLTRDAVVSQLSEVEHAVEQEKMHRSLSRSRRDTDLKELQEKLQREAAEKRVARLAQRMGEIPHPTPSVSSRDTPQRITMDETIAPRLSPLIQPLIISELPHSTASVSSGDSPSPRITMDETTAPCLSPLSQPPIINEMETSIRTIIMPEKNVPSEAPETNTSEEPLSMLHQIKKDFQQTKLPARSLSVRTKPSTIGGGLGEPVSRARSRSTSSNSRPLISPQTTNHNPCVLDTPSLYRVVGIKRYSVLLMPTLNKTWIRANDSHILVIPSTGKSSQITDPKSKLTVPLQEINLSMSPSSIVVWHGPKSAKFKRVKAMEFANLFREIELNSNARINEVADEREAFNYFWKHIDVPQLDQLSKILVSLPDSTTEVDKVSLFDVSDSTSKILNASDPIMSSPRLPNSSLESGKTFVVLVHLNEINDKPLAWVWVGLNSAVNVASISSEVELVFQTQTPVRIVYEGKETAAFKEHFGQLGRSNSFTGGLSTVSRSGSVVFEKKSNGLAGLELHSKMMINSAMVSATAFPSLKTAVDACPLIPTAPIKSNDYVHVVLDNSVKAVTPTIGEFHSQSIYLVLTHQKTILKWAGASCRAEHLKKPLPVSAKDITHDCEIVEERQYHESPGFTSLFPWIVYRLGTHPENTAYIPEGRIELYCVVGPRKLEQIPMNKNALWLSPFSEYVLRVGSTTYTTFTNGSNELPDSYGPVTILNELEFLETFLRVTNDTSQADVISRRLVKNKQLPKLMVIRNANPLASKEMPNPTWQDCHDDVICLFDLLNGQILVWIGSLVTSTAFLESAIQLARTYNKEDTANKIYVINSKNAPMYLRILLPGSTSSDAFPPQNDPILEDVQTPEEFFGPGRKSVFTLDQLQKRKDLPPSVDSTSLEKYLSDENFATYFKMTLSAFYALPKWKQHDMKKKLGLF